MLRCLDCVILLCLFFFFKQKTAYEMRISDWSSDVCSSDLQNHGNYIVQLGNVVRWMGEQAEALGVDLFPGFAAAEILYTDSGAVKGVATGDMGVARDGTHTEHYQPGMEIGRAHV